MRFSVKIDGPTTEKHATYEPCSLNIHYYYGMTTLPSLLQQACDELHLTVIRDLKAGGQKTVHLVESPDGLSVLKLVELGVSDTAAIERARREVQLLESIDHAHVVKVASSLVELGSPISGAAWLEEYLDGWDLGECVGSPWPVEDIWNLGLQVSAGLGALHDERVVHRDLSANNIRKLTTGVYKVMDPGFAKHTLRSGLTVGGQPGTRGFMTPEHLHAYSGPTPASDVFGLGQLMYLAATGKLPIPWLEDDFEYFRRLERAAMEPLANYRSDLPAELISIIEKSLHPHPARRFRNGKALHKALEAAQ